jgi:hypothetical protein
MTAVFLQFAFKKFEQGKGIGGTSGETSDYPVIVQAPHLAGIAFHYGVPHGYLAIATNGNGRAASD